MPSFRTIVTLLAALVVTLDSARAADLRLAPPAREKAVAPVYSLHFRSAAPVDSPRTIPLPTVLDRERPCPVGVEMQVLRLINRERVRHDLPLLRQHLQLEWAAREHSITMAARERMTHDNWLVSVRASGYQGMRKAQNVAWNQRSPEEAVDDWLESAGHRANILNPSFRFTGISCVESASGEPYWTELFGD